jgi:biopolymer transport protein ExbB/TolQ
MLGLDPSIIALCLGAIAICIVAAIDFHAPFEIMEIRYAVMRDRYYFAVVAYVTIAVVFYVFLVSQIHWLVNHLYPGRRAGLLVAIPATIAFMVLVPHLPLLHRVIEFLRTMMQTLARYPQAVETVIVAIARSPIKVTERARPELQRELEGYGVPARLIEKALNHDDQVLAAGAATMIKQVASLHTSFLELRGNKRFARFFRARKAAFDEMERQYRRMLRRSARALMLTEDIMVSDVDAQELVLEISDFIAEECEDLRVAYQRRLAEASLSVVDRRDSRIELIASFGYQIVFPQALPFAPLVTIFVLDFVVSVAPLFFLHLPQNFAVGSLTGGFSSLAHAVALTISIFFAIYPKASTNFARPSLYALPWSSYVVFGMISYLAGNAILWITYSTIPIAEGWLARSHPFAASSLFALIFLVNTVVLSILLDVRLRADGLDYHEARLRDGAAHAVVMACVMFCLLIGFTSVTRAYGLEMPDIPWLVHGLIVALFGVLGFVMGYLVPSTAEAYIESNKLIRKSSALDGNLLGWAAPASQPTVKS